MKTIFDSDLFQDQVILITGAAGAIPFQSMLELKEIFAKKHNLVQ